MATLLNLWYMIPSWAEEPFHSGHRRPSEITDIYIMIHNSNNIKIWNNNGNRFLFGLTTRGTVLKGHCIMKVEIRCFVEFLILFHFLFILQLFLYITSSWCLLNKYVEENHQSTNVVLISTDYVKRKLLQAISLSKNI